MTTTKYNRTLVLGVVATLVIFSGYLDLTLPSLFTVGCLLYIPLLAVRHFCLSLEELSCGNGQNAKRARMGTAAERWLCCVDGSNLRIEC